MSNTYAKKLLAQYFAKQAAEEPGHEASEAPSMEMLEHAMGGQGEGAEEDSAEALLSQLSPEELEELAASLSGEMQDPSQDAGGEDVEALAQAIQQNLAENPEASVEGAAPEQEQALDAIKSASYIEGFIKEALHTGLDIKQAVNMYDQALTEAVESLKTAATMALPSKGVRNTFAYKAREKANQAGDYVRGKAKAFGEHVKEKKKYYIGGGAAAATAGGAYLYNKNKKKDKEEGEEKTAAYAEGMYKRALEYGFSHEQAEQVVDDFLSKSAAPLALPSKGVRNTFAYKAREKANQAGDYVRGKAKAFGEHVDKKKKYYIGGGAAAATAGGAYLYNKNKKKDKEEEGKEKAAEYFEGMYKRALEYGLSHEQAEQFIRNRLS
jgi:hypothetical protein